MAQNSWLSARLDFLVAGDRDFDFGGFKMIINPWWLNRGGKIIGGWVEVDWWLQNFCSDHRAPQCRGPSRRSPPRIFHTLLPFASARTQHAPARTSVSPNADGDDSQLATRSRLPNALALHVPALNEMVCGI